MSHGWQVWALVGSIGAATWILKGAGPALVGDRELPAPADRMLALLAPALLSALVTTEVFGSGRTLAVDARLLGVAVAAVALRLRLPLLVAIVAAAAATALARVLGWDS